jgi:hypothetical protein
MVRDGDGTLEERKKIIDGFSEERINTLIYGIDGEGIDYTDAFADVLRILADSDDPKKRMMVAEYAGLDMAMESLGISGVIEKLVHDPDGKSKSCNCFC